MERRSRRYTRLDRHAGSFSLYANILPTVTNHRLPHHESPAAPKVLPQSPGPYFGRRDPVLESSEEFPRKSSYLRS